MASANTEMGGLPGLTCADVCERPALRTPLSSDEDLRRRLRIRCAGLGTSIRHITVGLIEKAPKEND